MSDTTLLGWLGRAVPPKKQPVAINPRSLSPLISSSASASAGGGRPQKRKPNAEPTLYVLGVMGIRNDVSYEEIQTNILAPVVEAWGIPDEVVAPAEGDATQVIVTWCHNHKVPLRLVSCDWAKQGKRAGMMRDARLQKEATHLVLLQGPRSNKLAELAVKLERKNYPVVISPRPGRAVVAPVDLEAS